MVKMRVKFFSNVKSNKMFSIQTFYKTDIEILRDLDMSVQLSKSVFDYLCFWSYDMSFIYFYKYGLFVALISRIFNKKVIFTGGIDDLDVNYSGKVRYIKQVVLFVLCCMLANKIIIVSENDYSHVMKLKGFINKKKLCLIPHSIDVAKYSSFNIRSRKKNIVTICWMLTKDNPIRKGVDKTIKLFKQIHSVDNDFRLIIIGPIGEGTQYLRELVNTLDMEHLVYFTDSISEKDKIGILHNSLIYSQLSKYEGFGIAAVEALAAGNIVIHSNEGGLEFGVGTNGVIIKNLDSFDTDLIFNIINNTYLHQEMVYNGVEYVNSKYSYSVRYNKIKEVISTYL
jgi:glycosyltransferase involved in cell wall biosynthesis